MKKEYIVFVGRFQPFHNGHLEVCKRALEKAEKLIIVIGSSNSACTIKNPWTFAERKEMIIQALSDYKDRIVFLAIRDFLYNDVHWITSLQNIVSQITNGSNDVGIIGHRKDDSSYYLDFFPQWQLFEEPNYHGLNSTDVRNKLFSYKEFKPFNILEDIVIPSKNSNVTDKTMAIDYSQVPETIALYIFAWISKNNETFNYLVSEYKYIKEYKEKWANAPYQPTFVTTDAVVLMNGHVLVVKRKVNPGKGLFALPGGFVNPNESIEKSMIRELKEETSIVYPTDKLKASIKAIHVFDHPYRSMRGRTITHAYFINIKDCRALPEVKGGDDAAEAMWLPINDIYLNEDKFFEDHIHIITHFINKV